MRYVGKSGCEVQRKSVIEDAISAMRRISDSMPQHNERQRREAMLAVSREADKWRPKLSSKPDLDRIDMFIRTHM